MISRIRRFQETQQNEGTHEHITKGPERLQKQQWIKAKSGIAHVAGVPEPQYEKQRTRKQIQNTSRSETKVSVKRRDGANQRYRSTELRLIQILDNIAHFFQQLQQMPAEATVQTEPIVTGPRPILKTRQWSRKRKLTVQQMRKS